MTIPMGPPRMAGTMNNGFPHGPANQHWQPESGVRARDMLGQPLLSGGMNPQPQMDEFGGMDDGFDLHGPPHGQVHSHRGPQKRGPGRHPVPNFDPSFNPDNQPPFAAGQRDHSEDHMLGSRPPHMPPLLGDDDMPMDDDMSLGNTFSHGRTMGQGFDEQSMGMGGPPQFNNGPTFGRRGAMRGQNTTMGNGGFLPLGDMHGPLGSGGHGQDGEDDFMGGPGNFPSSHHGGADMTVDDSHPFPHIQEPSSRIGRSGPIPRRQRRFSDSNLPSQRPFRESFDITGRPVGLRRDVDTYDRDGDSTRYARSDPADRRSHRVNYDDDTTTSSSSGPRRKQILFYDEKKPYFAFSNRSPYSVVYKGRKYPTAEHLYHALKFEHHRPDISEIIRTCSSRANVAISEARRYESQIRSDWQSVKLRKMEEIVALKFEQHRDLRDQLLDTGDDELVEASYIDSYWGVGKDGHGRNEFGRILQRLRKDLRRGGNSRSRKRYSSPRSSSRPREETRYSSDRGRRTQGSVHFFDPHQPHFGFNNFSPYPVKYQGKRYPTSQHLFQALKPFSHAELSQFLNHDPGLAEHIRTFSEYPDIITAEAHRREGEVRRDWRSIASSMMEEVLWHKFNQHPELKRELLATGNANIIFDSREDVRWGVGSDGRGRNELGRALEKVRSRLRSGTYPRSRSSSQLPAYRDFEIPPPAYDQGRGGMAFRSMPIRPAKLTRHHSRGPSLPNIMNGLFGRRNREQIFEKHRPDLAEHIRTCSSNPHTAIAEARRFANDVRSDWRSVNGRKVSPTLNHHTQMEETLFQKFTQHRSLGEMLVETGDDELIEENDRDSYWGIGPDGRGRNEFGKILEKVRSRLRR
ncbi:hypothetical protein BXZ70DRAFT_907037 [Cristinia sonorae]|uniref:NADAR domain-containing protein n=1 Tax=Cristinia sonorae TaxID=1940300 RepID=A0A8K0XQ46_9AGAR|nr:hypothetical protein BXZ70DRAFT_907037 [Cristinia sonorae]